MELVRYDAACRAIAQAKSIDDVKEITNRAEAARAYARQAKNRQLELDALEIRVRAERRLGEIILDLKKSHLIAGGGARGNRAERVTLSELGVDSNISGGAQRLAKLPSSQFEADMSSWRSRAETARSVEVPLQRYRVPSITGDRQKAAFRAGRQILNHSDPLDRFRAMDGRRIADWRHGELDRLFQLAGRIQQCVEVLRANRPVANPDQLETMEMTFGTSRLEALLSEIWEAPIPPGSAGVEQVIAGPDRRPCAECGVWFTPKRTDNRPGRNRFCSHSCGTKGTVSLRKCGT